MSRRLYCRYGIEYRRGRYFSAGCRKIGDRGIPVLGVNIGRLGFLADVPAEEVEPVLNEILEGKYKIEERSLLQVEFNGLSENFGLMLLMRSLS